MRLIGTRSLLGQKVEVRLPTSTKGESWCFVLRILWTCAVGDELFENGGVFVEARATSGLNGSAAPVVEKGDRT